MTTTLENRLAHARELRAQGYNCAQAVVMAFPDVTGLEPSDASRIAMGLGGGVGAMGEICGVATAIALVVGLSGSDDPMKKAEAYKTVKQLCERFKAQNCGCIRCHDLKSLPGGSPCNDLINQGIAILDEHFRGNEA